MISFPYSFQQNPLMREGVILHIQNPELNLLYVNHTIWDGHMEDLSPEHGNLLGEPGDEGLSLERVGELLEKIERQPPLNAVIFRNNELETLGLIDENGTLSREINEQFYNGMVKEQEPGQILRSIGNLLKNFEHPDDERDFLTNLQIAMQSNNPNQVAALFSKKEYNVPSAKLYEGMFYQKLVNSPLERYRVFIKEVTSGANGSVALSPKECLECGLVEKLEAAFVQENLKTLQDHIKTIPEGRVKPIGNTLAISVLPNGGIQPPGQGKGPASTILSWSMRNTMIVLHLSKTDLEPPSASYQRLEKTIAEFNGSQKPLF